MNSNPGNLKQPTTPTQYKVDVSVCNDDKNAEDELDARGAIHQSLHTDKPQQIPLLINLLNRFEFEFSSPILHLPHHIIRRRRQNTTEILNCIKELLFQSTTSIDRAKEEQFTCAATEIRRGLNILTEHWGYGDVEIYTALLDTFLRSFAVKARKNGSVSGNNVSLQQFILLDLLPYATGGASENCLEAQAEIAKALLHTMSTHHTVYEPIVSWCRWYLNFHRYHRPHSLYCSTTLSHDALLMSAPLPSEIHKLTLELLRMVPLYDLLPSALSITLECFALTCKSSALSLQQLQQYAKSIVIILRKRWIEINYQPPIQPHILAKLFVDDRLSERKTKLEFQLRLISLLEEALLDEDTYQGNLLTDVYLKLLLSFGERKVQPSTVILERQAKRSKFSFDNEKMDELYDSAVEPNVLKVVQLIPSIRCMSYSKSCFWINRPTESKRTTQQCIRHHTFQKEYLVLSRIRIHSTDSRLLCYKWQLSSS
jgi:hypothetical protein